MSAPEPVSLAPRFASPRTRGAWLAALLVAMALLGWFAVGFDLADLRLLAREAAGEEISELERRAHALLRTGLSAVQGVATAAAGVAFLAWLQLARRNLRALGARKPSYSTRWAVAGCLVPGLNLVLPYRVVGEIWRASDPSIADPFAWRQARLPRWLPLWWAAVVGFVACALLAALTDASAGRDLARLRVARGAALAADLTAALAASLSYFVVVRIGRAQERKHQASTERDAGPAPPGYGLVRTRPLRTRG